jgi:hypothetical protein
MGTVQEWFNGFRLSSKSEYYYFIGRFKEEKYLSFDALRALIIYPSEYIRDSASDWDSFELVVGRMTPLTAPPSGPIWISTENYKRRAKALVGGNVPSPDWEYNSLADSDVTNARLRDIVVAIERATKSHSQKLVPPPSGLPAKP